jgi:tripartite-type tricarboxylate transporter receptor subunit TctC
LTIGVGLGSLTEAVAREFELKFPNTKLTYVGYSGTIKPMIDLQAGVLDLSVGLPADLQQHVETGKLFVIGSSGRKDYPNFPTFRSQGLGGFDDLVSNYAMYVSATVSDEQAQEIHSILTQAATKSDTLPKLYASDRCTPANLNFKETNDLFNKWLRYWPDKLKALSNQ